MTRHAPRSTEGWLASASTAWVWLIPLGTGRTHMMQGAVHVVIFGAFLFLALVP